MLPDEWVAKAVTAVGETAFQEMMAAAMETKVKCKGFWAHLYMCTCKTGKLCIHS